MVRKKQFRRNFIREWREHRGYSQERLAARIGRTAGYISLLENRRTPYTQDALEALAEALDCQPTDLLIRDPKEPNGILSVWGQLDPLQKQQAIDLIKVLARKAP